MKETHLRAMLVAAAACVCCACGSGDEQVAGIDGGGARNPVTARGPIQGFGSVIVNEVHYELSSAQIEVDGMPQSESDLALGQVVTINGSVDSEGVNAVADVVVHESNVHGPVEERDADAGRLVVMGQEVYVDASTVIDLSADRSDLEAVAVGERVAVSGFVTSNGGIQATRIASIGQDDDLRLLGIISNVDTVLFRFDINGVTVSYANVQILEGFPGGEPSNGQMVRVEAEGFSPEGWLMAEGLELRDIESVGDAGDEAEIEGLITRFASMADFDVSGLAITTTADTDYEGGSEADVQLNVKVQVEGRVDADGAIVASKIEIKDGGAVLGGG